MSEDSFSARRRLAAAIKEARLQRQWRLCDVAEYTYWSTAKLSRIESGVTAISVSDVHVLGDILEVAPQVKARWRAMAITSRQPAPLAPFTDILTIPQIQMYSAMSSAIRVREYCAGIIPLLAWNDAYAEAVLRVYPHRAQQWDRWHEALHRIRDIRKGRERPYLELVMTEAVFQRLVGGRDVMISQLQALKALSADPRITLRMLPYATGVFPGMLDSYTLLEHKVPDRIGQVEVCGYHVLPHAPAVMMKAHQLPVFQRGWDEVNTYASPATRFRAQVDQALTRLENHASPS